jgi:hypothetical protein
MHPGPSEQTFHQPFGIERTIVWRPERALRRSQPRPAASNLVRPKPLAIEALLLLPCDLLPELLRLAFGLRHAGNPLLPKAQIRSHGLLKSGGKARVVVSTCEAQREQRVARTGLDLGRQHTGGRTPGLSGFTTSLDDQDLPAGGSQLPGTRGPYRTAAYDYGVMAPHYPALKLSETLGRTAG